MAAAAATGGVPTLSITMDRGQLADVHRDKEVTWPSVTSIVGAADPAHNLASTAVEFKGRGNTSWTWPKKPYQIKFPKKTSVLGMPKAKAWVLLANHAEASLLRNHTALSVANGLRLAGTPHESRHVNLVVNGHKLGLYQITEKIEVGENRLELSDPAGILVELDNIWAHLEPPALRFTSAASRTEFVLKDQVGEVDDDHVMDADVRRGWNDIQQTITTLDRALHVDKPDWNTIASLIDVDSFARFYLLDEFTGDIDASRSSRFFYKDGPDDRLHAGPAWDYDLSMGGYGDPDRILPWSYSVVNADWYGSAPANDWYVQLFRHPQFIRRIHTEYDRIGRQAIASATASIAPTAAQISTAANENFTVWPNSLNWPTPVASHAQAVNELRAWASARSAFLDAVYGDPSRPVLTSSVFTEAGRWSPAHSSGAMQGNREGRDLEAFTLALLPGAQGTVVAGSVEADARVAGGGWVGWKPAGTTVGNPGGADLQAIRIRLTGGLTSRYDLHYRVRTHSMGWLDWVKNGQETGLAGATQAIEAIQVVLVDKPAAGASLMPAPRRGWVEAGPGHWFCYAAPGVLHTGWLLDQGSWYYLASDGLMATGWVKDGWHWYYLNSSGAMATGWLNDHGTWYYLHPGGAMATGWLHDGQHWYYLDPASGAMATGWIRVHGTWYHLNRSGAWIA
ncbi:MAG: CotH kinase family protein [Propioniciclava sp.]|uniref:CotH kinase family protein n=1 Tax=Propioniciclava sp. TaxID=2038686 RepID=UPI0039E6E251